MINIKSNKCTIGHFKQHYENDFNHSKYLKQIFGVFNYQGCDYNNPNGLNIEFKESFQKLAENRIRFATYLKDKLESDYIVFVYNHISYVHKSKQILGKYKYANKKKIAQPYLTTIRKNYIAKFDDYQELKDFLDKMKPKHL